MSLWTMRNVVYNGDCREVRGYSDDTLDDWQTLFLNSLTLVFSENSGIWDGTNDPFMITTNSDIPAFASGRMRAMEEVRDDIVYFIRNGGFQPKLQSALKIWHQSPSRMLHSRDSCRLNSYLSRYLCGVAKCAYFNNLKFYVANNSDSNARW